MKKDTTGATLLDVVQMSLMSCVDMLEIARRSTTPRKARGMRKKPRTRKGTTKTLSVNGKPIGRPRKTKTT